MSEEFEIVKGGDNVFKFDENNKEFIGKLIAIGEGDFGNKKYTFENSEGKLITIFGTTFLDNRIKTELLNETLKIEYKGEVKTQKGRMAKSFEVYKKKME